MRQSYEHYFQSAGLPRFILDLRNRDLGHPDSAWLAGPRRYLSIGWNFDPEDDDHWHHDGGYADEFDVMIYFEQSTPSILVPAVFPESF